MTWNINIVDLLSGPRTTPLVPLAPTANNLDLKDLDGKMSKGMKKRPKSERLSFKMPAPWHNLILMINTQSLVGFQRRLNGDIEDKSSGD